VQKGFGTHKGSYGTARYPDCRDMGQRDGHTGFRSSIWLTIAIVCDCTSTCTGTGTVAENLQEAHRGTANYPPPPIPPDTRQSSQPRGTRLFFQPFLPSFLPPFPPLALMPWPKAYLEFHHNSPNPDLKKI